MQQLLTGQRIDDAATEFLRETAPLSSEPLWVAYSGGKDSCVLLDLVKRSGVPFEAHYSFVPVDPPELRKFVKAQARIAENQLTIDLPKTSLIRAAEARGIMPTRNRRWCCEVLKENRGGESRLVATGIRAAESGRRAKRKMMEGCTRQRALFVHPILKWTTHDVWQYIRSNGLDYCSLYDEGWERIGCVLCPMTRNTEAQIARWPQIAAVWRRIAERVWETRPKVQKRFATADALFAWWLDRDARWKREDDCPLFGSGMEAAPGEDEGTDQ